MSLNIKFNKSAGIASPPASMTKLMTGYVMRQWVPDADLDDTVSVNSSDIVPGTTANLLNGDVTTYRHLSYGMLLPSGNDAAHCIARNVGALMPGGGDPVDKFVAEMNVQAGLLGMATAAFFDASGVSASTRMSPAEVATLMLAFITDAYLLTVSGTLIHSMVITGANARTYNVTHTIDPNGTVKFPEFICGKTGTTVEAGPCVVMYWDAGSTNRVSVVMNATSDLDRYFDLRKLMNYELARSA